MVKRRPRSSRQIGVCVSSATRHTDYWTSCDGKELAPCSKVDRKRPWWQMAVAYTSRGMPVEECQLWSGFPSVPYLRWCHSRDGVFQATGLYSGLQQRTLGHGRPGPSMHRHHGPAAGKQSLGYLDADVTTGQGGTSELQIQLTTNRVAVAVTLDRQQQPKARTVIGIHQPVD